MKKKFDLKSFVCGVLVMALILTLAMPVAALTAKNITIYSGLKLFVDGEAFTPKDPNGKVVDVFASDGTTYLPVRAISEALGKPVEWDGSTQSVYVGDRRGNDVFLKAHTPLEKNNVTMPKSAEVNGAQRPYPLVSTSSYKSYATFALDGKYNEFTFTVGPQSNFYFGGEVNIYVDDTQAFSWYVSKSDLPSTHTVKVSGGLKMKIEFKQDSIVVYDMSLK